MKNKHYQLFLILKNIIKVICWPLDWFRKLCFLMKYKNKKDFVKYKDKYKDSRIFIVATGPSLTIEDLEKIRGEITISMNTIYALFAKTKWRPTYYMISDMLPYRRMLEKYDKKNSLSSANEVIVASPSFLNNKSVKKIVNDSGRKDKTLFFPQIYSSFAWNWRLKLINKKDIGDGIIGGGGVAIFATLFAMYMGAKEIYLLGTDCNFTGDNIHAGLSKKEDLVHLKEARFLEKSLQQHWRDVKKLSKTFNVKIYNATRGGKLEIFERVDLDEVPRK